ncbi:MAG: 30S ribosomal protein S20 [Chitinivibrionales bacterium]|nr:30S ribosomal protein S20 [Chitinivibrionales bacterium]MBD3394083.1 30S ribosomal protein S20 [Chitinivibrionales bacterium]
MPSHKSCRKRIATSKKQNVRNRTAKSRMNTAIKRVLSAKDSTSAQTELKNAYSVIDKTAQAGIIHRNMAANRKASLAKAVRKIGA